MDKKEHLTRKTFIRNTALGIAGIGAAPLLTGFQQAESTVNKSKPMKLLKNVRLETGFEYDGDEVIATKTDLFCIELADGKITSIRKNDPKADAFDAKGMLMLPAFKDMHIHLDKTFYGGPWKIVKRRSGGVKGMIALEQEILPEMLKTSTYRAEKLIELLQSKGSSFARSHVNIEPTSKLQSLKNLEIALENKKAGFEAELVAFPQHGLYYTDSVPYMKEAAQTDIDFIGGLDPYSVDGSIEKPIDFTVQLALDHNKGIDIHLHESGQSGVDTIEYLIKKVLENPTLKGKTYLSHCFALSAIDAAKQEELAEKLAEAQIGIISTIPFGGRLMPIPTLYKHGVHVATGIDSVIDHWGIYGTGSVLDKASLMAQLYGFGNEFMLSRSLRLATDNVLPLDDQGKQQWPKPNDKANFVLVNSSCSAEAVARVPEIEHLIHAGNVVY